MGDEQKVWMSHGDEVVSLPVGMEGIGNTENCNFAAVADEHRRLYGMQFHLEVTHTENGMKMLENFVDACSAEHEWNLKEHLEQMKINIQKDVKNRKVFMLVSGGVDSTVAFALLEKSLGASNVYGLFVDTGLMRKNEANEVRAALGEAGFKNLHIEDASADFLKALKNVTSPEKKRMAIGDTFLEVQKRVLKKMKLNTRDWVLGQGTIYPDTIESGGTRNAARIKTHHNRVPQIEEMIKKGLVIEPLKEFYKDEVRYLGEKLGLPKPLLARHPFPGPGLSVRILCAKKAELPSTWKVIEKKVASICDAYDLQARVLPIQSVGVQGDSRTYKNPVVVSGEASWDIFESVSTKITNQVQGVNRVVLSVVPEKVTSVEFGGGFMTPDRVKLLQEVDDLVTNFCRKKGLYDSVWQFPVILAPIAFNGRKGEVVVLRPVCSTEAMTANFYQMDFALLRKLADLISAVKGISGVVYDITHKPPGTIEWE
jgi:GMP synthase (glutamine-hydrolysing)